MTTTIIIVAILGIFCGSLATKLATRWYVAETLATITLERKNEAAEDRFDDAVAELKEDETLSLDEQQEKIAALEAVKDLEFAKNSEEFEEVSKDFKKEPLWTKSHCRDCKNDLKTWQKIPVVSWLMLKGKCSDCGSKIPVFYPLTEILTSVVFVALFSRIVDLGWDLTPTTLIVTACLVFAFAGAILTLIDLKTMLLPTRLMNFTGIALLVLLTAAALVMKEPSRLLAMIISGSALFFFYLIIWWFRPDGVGYGDVRLAFISGVLLGWLSYGSAAVGLAAPFIVLSIISLPLMIVGILNKKSKVPFGPWIVFGTIASLIWGDIIANLYLTIGGFL